MKRALKLFLICCIIAGMIPAQFVVCYANSVEITACADSYVGSGTLANKNYGAASILFSSAANGNVGREIYIKFDLSSLSDEVIDTAKLSLAAAKSGGKVYNQTFDVYRVEEDGWTEGTGTDAGAAASGTDITWNVTKNFTTEKLLSAPRPVKVDTPYQYDITEAVANENDGILSLRIITTYQAAATNGNVFHSRESENEQCRPKIVITTVDDPDIIAVKKDLKMISVNSETTESFELPSGGANGSSYTWSSDNEQVISVSKTENGYAAAVTRADADTTVKLVCTAVSGEYSEQREFYVNVIGSATSVADLDAAEISVEYTDSMRTVSLPGSGKRGSVITWESSAPEIISSEGAVNRPQLGSAVTVTLTASVQYGTEQPVLKTFTFTINPLGYLVPEKDTYVKRAASEDALKSFGSDSILITDEANRKILLGFDLADVPKNVKSATLAVTKSDANTNNITVSKYPDNSWDESKLCFNDYLNYSDDVLKTREVRFSGAKNSRFTFDLTSEVTEALHGSGKLTVELTKNAAGSSQFPASIYSIEAGFDSYDADYRPRLIFTYTDDSDELAAIKAAASLNVTGYAVENIALPSADGVNIVWKSSNGNIIAADGTVSFPDTETEVVLTAEVSCGEKTVSKDFIVKVPDMSYPYVTGEWLYTTKSGANTSYLMSDGIIHGVYIRALKSEPGIAVIVLYKDGKAEKVKIAELDPKPGKRQFCEFNEPVSNDGAYSFKVFVFSDINSIKPLSK